MYHDFEEWYYETYGIKVKVEYSCASVFLLSAHKIHNHHDKHNHDKYNRRQRPQRRLYISLGALGPKLKQMDESIYEAALDMGATPLRAIVKVILPQILSSHVLQLLTVFLNKMRQ